ncbi:cupin domain-containing protein [Rhizobium paknamense]|uniref:Cupin superfamily protein n=1 Tax=Rhizobium paknamense TaxID=1206817 RepID=A0ABU0IAZ1_9HYPH|nr:cupin domain-containing protein [Rhizobium paknamense]MDQ0455366.1 putative cupin superfamily protein [Rhizobium paknamense]
MPIKLLLAGLLLVAPRRQVEKAIVSAPANRLEMKPAPINPDWIIDGNPQARVGDHSRSDDEAGTTAVWECTAGTFRWYFGWDETVVIQEGAVEVTGEDGERRLLTAGDIAYFKGGTWATWRIERYVRKIAFLRKPFPEPLATLYQLRNALRAGQRRGL